MRFFSTFSVLSVLVVLHCNPTILEQIAITAQEPRSHKRTWFWLSFWGANEQQFSLPLGLANYFHIFPVVVWKFVFDGEGVECGHRVTSTPPTVLLDQDLVYDRGLVLFVTIIIIDIDSLPRKYRSIF